VRRRLAALLLAAAAGLGPSCRKAGPPRPAASSRVPKGDVIWLSDPAAAADPTLDAELARIGAVAVLLPAGTLGAASGPGAFTAVEPPPRAIAATPVVLVVEPDAALAASLSSSEGPEADALAEAASAALWRIATSGAFGKVAGVHLDFPVAPRSAARYASVVSGLKRGLNGIFVSISLRELPADPEQRKKLGPLVESADALVAFVFGDGPRVDPVATDALGRPWWAAYDLRVASEIRTAGGESRGPVPERLAEPLSGSPKFQFENDLSGGDAAISAFTLTARGPVRQDGLTLEAGDRVAFRLPSISEMLFQLGSNLAGKRHALGRAVVFGGATEGERVFGIAALEDVLSGRTLTPVLEADVRPAGRTAVTVDLVNRSHHASVASRVDNWIEVDLTPARPADVQLGGFDRYEVYDRSGQRVVPGRATTVRLFETLIAPMESVTPARITVRGALPAACCRYRVHAMAAAGPEVSGDWKEPPPPPTPVPSTKGAAGKKR
jgi:hypothetical protein